MHATAEATGKTKVTASNGCSRKWEPGFTVVVKMDERD
jgi:hypothetical protein